MTVWRITGKIIRTTIMLITYARGFNVSHVSCPG